MHVAHVIIDDAVDTEFVRSTSPEKYAVKSIDGILSPDHIAENCWHLRTQSRDVWTFELDIHP